MSVPILDARTGHAMVSFQGKVLLFGGSLSADTWEWSAGAWSRKSAAISPSARSKPKMTVLGSKVVLFGGNDYKTGTWLNDTWEWDGATWSKRNPANAPPVSGDEVFAAAGSVAVLYEPPGETWTWDGSDWKKLAITTPALHGVGMTTQVGKAVLVGLQGQPETPSTYSFDGVSWSSSSAAQSGTPRPDGRGTFGAYGSFAAYLGCPGVTWTAETAMLGTSWTTSMTSSPGPCRHYNAMAEADGKLVMFGGTGKGALNDTWLWDGADWTLARRDAPPAAGVMASLGSKLVFVVPKSPSSKPGVNAEVGETWEWDGAVWTQKQTTVIPEAPERHQTFIASRGNRVVLFIYGDQTGTNTTYEYDGTTWVKMAPAHAPNDGSARYTMGSRGDKVILFTAQGNTWEWDGNDWKDRAPVTHPRARSNGAMATLGDKLLLFGGEGWTDNTVRLNDTWEWDGNAWKQRILATNPPPRDMIGQGMATVGDKILLFGGRSATGHPLKDAWEYDGTNWTERLNTDALAAHLQPRLASFKNSAILFGGESAATDMWIFY